MLIYLLVSSECSLSFWISTKAICCLNIIMNIFLETLSTNKVEYLMKNCHTHVILDFRWSNFEDKKHKLAEDLYYFSSLPARIQFSHPRKMMTRR